MRVREWLREERESHCAEHSGCMEVGPGSPCGAGRWEASKVRLGISILICMPWRKTSDW